MPTYDLKMKKYDIAVAYRIYPNVSKKPYVYQKDKFRLATLCLKSFRKSIGNLNVKLFALLDNCPNEYETLFQSYFDKDELEIIKYDGIGNRATFNKQIDLLLNQKFSETIYFAEDDYFYLPNQFNKMLTLINSFPKGAFVSPYDHPDYYSLSFHENKFRINVFNNTHWRNANSTCLTFLTTKNVLQQTEEVFRSYGRGNYDSSLWLSLTKKNLVNPKLMIKFLMQQPFYFKSVMKSWTNCWKQIIFGRKWELWIPVPSIATHMDEIYLSPGIDWKSIINLEVEKIELEYGNLTSPKRKGEIGL